MQHCKISIKEILNAACFVLMNVVFTATADSTETEQKSDTGLVLGRIKKGKCYMSFFLSRQYPQDKRFKQLLNLILKLYFTYIDLKYIMTILNITTLIWTLRGNILTVFSPSFR